MRGTHRVTVRNRRVQFTLELERNITVIRGDSATGKTTLMGMLRDYEEQGIQSGVSVSCDKPCRVLSSFDWESRLRTISDSIVFVDEGNAFVNSQEFAQAIRGTSNYYVLITREMLADFTNGVVLVINMICIFALGKKLRALTSEWFDNPTESIKKFQIQKK